jgi:hypothetical protein
MKNEVKVAILSKIRRAGKHADAYRVAMTPDLARELLGLMKHNRPVKNRAVKYYCSQIQRGEWEYTGETIILNKRGEVLDGQHRLIAIVETGITVEVLIVLDVSEVNGVWKKINTGVIRTVSDMLDVPNRANVSATLSLLAREEAGTLHGSARVGLKPCDAHAVLEAYPETVNAVSAIVSNRFRSGTFSYAFVRCSHYDADAARVFFEQLDSGIGCAKTDPAYVLRETLLKDAAAIRHLSPSHILAFVIKAWTAYVEGKPLRFLRWVETEEFPEWPGDRLSRLPVELVSSLRASQTGGTRPAGQISERVVSANKRKRAAATEAVL